MLSLRFKTTTVFRDSKFPKLPRTQARDRTEADASIAEVQQEEVDKTRSRLVDNRTFSRGYPYSMRSYGGLLEARGSNLAPLKSTFNAEHFICRLSWSILNGFGAIHSYNVYCSLKSLKFTKNPYFGGSRSFKVIDVGTTGKLVGSTCYDKQQVCVYLQPFSRYMSQ